MNLNAFLKILGGFLKDYKCWFLRISGGFFKVSKRGLFKKIEKDFSGLSR